MGMEKVWLLPVLAVLILWAFYGSFEVSLSMANKIAALTALFLICLSLVIGPLSRFWPDIFNRYKQHRKFLGVAGLAFAVAHVAISLTYAGVQKTLLSALSPLTLKTYGLYAGVAGFLIFLAMSITSTKSMMERLGYDRWKAIQMLGYVALALAIVHFYFMELKPDGVFRVRPLGLAIFWFAVGALLARFLVLLYNLPHRKKYEEHFAHKNKRKIKN